MNMQKNLKPVEARLRRSLFSERMELNRHYMKSLDERRLMASYFMEAGLNSNIHLDSFPKHYGGWEEPDWQVRGAFAGHYMSACAYLHHFEKDGEMKRRGDLMVDYLALCQKENEHNWAGSIPPVYLERIARDKWVWAPQYMIHKTFMGLIDMYRYANNEKALSIADAWADWFVSWTGRFDSERLAKLADWESGGLMESWADLYAITGDEKYKTLASRYYRKNLFDPLISGEDALTHRHANTSIPEAHGCARAYETTGEEKYRKAVEAFWHFGMETRAAWATGGQNNREAWVSDLTENLSASTQEFCTVYNSVRLADYLLCWTGEAKYADYIERLLYNGYLAQQNRETAQYCYFLPMAGGSKKKWEDKYNTFYCCIGTMVQAQSSYGDKIAYQNKDTVVISQYIPFGADISVGGGVAAVSMDFCEAGYEIAVGAPNLEFTLRLRLPGWSKGFGLFIDGEPQGIPAKGGWIDIARVWGGKTAVRFVPEYRMAPVSLDARDSRHAFCYGPVLMAGLSDGEHSLYGSAEKVANSIDTKKMAFADPRGGGTYIQNKGNSFKLVPLYKITDESYQIYFPCIE